MTLSTLPKRGILALVLIASVAISLSVISFQYASYTSNRIAELATNEIRTNSDVKAHDISKIIENKMDKVTAVLRTLASSPAIHNAELPRAHEVIALRQESTKDITDGYFWLDRDGKLLYSSKFSGNQSLYEAYRGIDLSSQDYFAEPKKNGKAFYSSIIEAGEEHIPKLYFAMPILDSQQVGDGTDTLFNGVVVAGIRTDVLAQLVKSDLNTPFQSDVVLLDRTGTIMYSTNQSSLGRNVLTPEYKSYIYSLAPESKESIDNLLADLANSRAGSEDIKFQDTVFTFSYAPVKIEAENLLMLYVYSPHTLTSEVNLLVDQQRAASAIIIAAIGAVAVGIGVMIVSWNSRLSAAVDERTKELKAKSEQLLAHDKLQREFINVAAHELRTPIQPLLGVMELIQQSIDGKEKVEITKDEVDMLTRNARRLERLSSDILEVSRIESQSMKLNKEAVDMREKIQNVVKDITPTLQNNRDLQIVFESRVASPVIVYGDKPRLFEVLSNLIRNAIKFTKEGSIRVILDKQNGDAIVRVVDTGSGIDHEIFPKLFTKFATKSDQGTGLGLYVSKAIIEAHGGKIWAENNPDGRGATFTFRLPLASSENVV